MKKKIIITDDGPAQVGNLIQTTLPNLLSPIS